MIKSNKTKESEDYPLDNVDKLPNVDKEGKVVYTDQLASISTLRASTGHLRNMSSYDNSGDNFELPNIKSAQRHTLMQGDLEKKLK